MKRNVICALLAVLLSAGLLFTACAARSAAPAEDQSASAAYAPAPAAGPGFGAAEAADSAKAESDQQSNAPVEMPQDADVRKIVYNAYMSVTADDPAAALQLLTEKTQALGGYLSGSYTTNDELGAVSCSATLKVPADKLETLVAAAGDIGKVNSYQLSSDDISLSYYDIQARLGSAEAEEAQLLELLKSSKTVEEVLAVRESLARVRSDIESYRGQINLWDNLVAYATLDITVNRTPRAAVEGEGELIALWKASDVGKKMSLGFQNSLRFVVNAVGAIGIFLAYALVPVGLVLGVVFGIRAILRATAGKRSARKERRRLKREAKQAKRAARTTVKRE